MRTGRLPGPWCGFKENLRKKYSNSQEVSDREGHAQFRQATNRRATKLTGARTMTMKSIVSLAVLSCCAFQAQATEYRFVADDFSAQTRFCVAAAEGDVDGLRSQIRKMRQSPHHPVKSIVNSIRCNDQPAAQFAHRFGATDTFAYLYRLTAKEHRALLPETSVEEVARQAASADEPDIVVVRVAGR
jgi:hypothetical protein